MVVCFRNVDTECMKKMNDLNAMDDRELCISIDENVKRGQQMALNRAAIANSDGLFCYKQFYDKYYKKLEKLLMEEEGTNCPELLAKTTVHSVRKDATKAIAEITQAMITSKKP
ncbi:unnamed protein product [Medioppia subpectinata]|uniref:Uncharacterized protein n=1 Tax=Medioppia subpectinata TaxID=1979941 RepID=A0A7R9KY45_9ACAR|nr:unnamed protein product [Medioppia subpectinata]CAG2110937.1 unnamed protein product [Medioppia subpectinata]